MTLRNAFGELATEETLAKVAEQGRKEGVRNPSQGSAIPYTKDQNDRMRVIADAGYIEIRGMNLGWHGGPAAPYGSGAPNSMDARGQQMLQSRMAFNGVRTNRWRFT